MIENFMRFLARILGWETAPTTPVEAPNLPQEPSKPPEPPPQPKKATLEAFCLAIRDFEGVPGDANYRNNNPGNCKWNPEGYLPIYGKVRRSPAGFAIFPTYELGWLYLKNMVRGMIHKRPNQTIYEFMLRYAPPSDNNPTARYADFIGKRLSVDSRVFKVGGLL